MFGHVYSLSHFPEKEVVVEAISIAQGECVSHQEEGTTDENGHFRIRGLKPHVSKTVSYACHSLQTDSDFMISLQCSYSVRLKPGSHVNKKIHKSLPEDVRIEVMVETPPRFARVQATKIQPDVF